MLLARLISSFVFVRSLSRKIHAIEPYTRVAIQSARNLREEWRLMPVDRFLLPILIASSVWTTAHVHKRILLQILFISDPTIFPPDIFEINCI